jgi:hypothetical protein
LCGLSGPQQANSEGPFSFAIHQQHLEEVAGHQRYTMEDGYSGFNQVELAFWNRHKTAFTTPWGIYIWLVMCFGLCNGPATFQRMMTFAFSDLLHHVMTIFIDDSCIHSEEKDHLH